MRHQHTPNLTMLRRIEHYEENMMRAMMPRTSEHDSARLTSAINPAPTEVHRVWRSAHVNTKPGFTLREVVNA